MPGCIVSATTASFRSVEKRRRRATPVMTSTFENVSDIGVCLGLYLGPPAKAGVRSKQGAVQVECGIGSHLRDLRDAYLRSCPSTTGQIRRAPINRPVSCRYHRLVGALLGHCDFDRGGFARGPLIRLPDERTT